jgi:hypothetical protein
MRPLAYAFLAYLAACLDPTEVNLVLSTDICEIRHVSVYMGDGTEPVATLDRQASLKCDKPLGNLVFIPSKAGDRFQVRVEATIRADNVCGPAGCVRVSRSVAFVQHAKLQLPVSIERSCLDVMCPKGKTCRQGVCIDDAVDCKIDNTCVETDGGTIEAGTVDSGVDSGSSCPASGSRIAMGTELYHWSFEDSDPASTVDSKKNIKIQLPMGFKRTPTTRCGNALSLGGQTDLSTLVMSPGIALSFELLVPPSTPLPAQLFNASGASQATWDVTLLGPPIRMQLGMGNVVQQTSTQSPIVPGVWHHIELYVSKQPTVEVAIDNAVVEMVPATGGIGAPPNLTMSVVGSIGGNPAVMQIDELGIFSGL